LREFNERPILKIIPFSYFLLLCVMNMQSSYACTTFANNGFVAKSYDWHESDAVVLFNKKNINKTSLVLRKEDKEVVWTSRFSSLTVNQYGQEFPLGGINEKGLVVEIMVLEGSEYPTGANLGTVNELQWIQFQLDQFETVDQVIAAQTDLRISKVHSDVHYLACDTKGNCATFEWHVRNYPSEPAARVSVRALTNSTYNDGMRYLQKYVGFGGSKPVPQQASSSLDRFVVAATLALPTSLFGLFDAFAGLDRVKTSQTQFQLVHDQSNLQLNFRSTKASAIKSLSLRSLINPKLNHLSSCGSPAQALDIHSAPNGDLTAQMKEFGEPENKKLVEKTLGTLGLPAALVEKVWRYPSRQSCMDSSSLGI
jgi:choloylglycine hydrolase